MKKIFEYNFYEFKNAIEKHDIAGVNKLLTDKSIEFGSHNGAAIRTAIRSGNEEMLKLLLASDEYEELLDPYINWAMSKDKSDYEIIQDLMPGMNTKVLQYLHMNEFELFRYGSDEDDESEGERTYHILGEILKLNDKELFDTAIEAAKIDNPDFSYADIDMNIINSAIVDGQMEFVTEYLNDPKLDDYNKFTLLSTFAQYDDLKVFDFLMEFPGMEEVVHSQDHGILRQAIRNKNYKLIERLFNDDAIHVIAEMYNDMTPPLLTLFMRLMDLDTFDELDAMIRIL